MAELDNLAAYSRFTDSPIERTSDEHLASRHQRVEDTALSAQTNPLTAVLQRGRGRR